MPEGTNTTAHYIKPATILFDVAAVVVLFPFFVLIPSVRHIHFAIYQVVSWAIVAYFSGYYEVYRYTSSRQLFLKIQSQLFVFLLAMASFLPFAKDTHIKPFCFFTYMAVLFAVIAAFKYGMLYLLKSLRPYTGNGQGSAIIVGYSPEAIALRDVLASGPEYNFAGLFSDGNPGVEVKGTMADVASFIAHNSVGEVYCSLSGLNAAQIKDMVALGGARGVSVKFIPDSHEVFSKNLRIDHYAGFPLLTLQSTALYEPGAQLFKRIFDIVFSSLAIVFILSWLTPLIALLIKLESRGPVFFKQSRPGLNEQEFFCYKFRSMRPNTITEQSATKNDARITRIGRFIRKTSIDELPQFFNVLQGDMSVVGPRPHLWAQNTRYNHTVYKYMSRMHVKPGITGLAQVSGYRGEITDGSEITNRTRYDVFYIENWSVLLDLKIIIQTVVNIFMGEEKAY